MNYKQVLTIILFFSMISSVLAIDVSWTVTEDVDLTTPKCIGSYALPEDEPGFYDLTVISPNGEEFPITSYPVFPNEVFTYISCGHKIEFTSSPFIPTKQFISLPIRFRKASGMQVQIKVDDGDFTTLGVELSAEDCFDTAKYVSRNDEYFLPVKFVDNKPHTITIRVLDRDAFCNDLTQVWFGSVLSEKDSVTTTFFEDVEGRGVSNAQIVSAVVKAFFAGTIAEVSNEDTDVETELGQVYGLTPTPLPVILKEEEQQNAIEIDTKIDDLPDDYFDTPNIKPNTYEIILVEGNPNVAHFIDVYGNDKYTVDGTHFYENYGKAVAPGVKGMYNSFKDFTGDITDFFFKTKYSNDDEELQTNIAREVLSDFQSPDEKKLEKIHGQASDKVANLAGPFSDLAAVPANSVITFAKEADVTEFAQGARLYIQERETYSAKGVYDNPSPELQGEGGLGTVSASLFTKYPKAVLFAKFEETYQRYLLAKELGRKK